MRVRLAGIASLVLAFTILHCSLTVDTDGLSGGAKDAGANGNDGAPAEGGAISESGADAPTGLAAIGSSWLAYGTQAGVVSVRRWITDSGTWGAEEPGPDVGGAPVRWVVPKETPAGSFLAIVSQATTPKLDVFQRTADGKWALGFSQPMTVGSRRAFDIDYESTSHAVMVAYGDGTPEVKVRRLVGGVWSSAVALKKANTLAPQWVELARSPLFDELTLAYSDDGNNLFAAKWDGKVWADFDSLEDHLNSLDWKCFDAAYDNAGGTLLVTWGRSEPVAGGEPAIALRYVTRAPGGALGEFKDGVSGRLPGPMVLAPEPGSKRILLSYVEYSCNVYKGTCDDFETGIWNGDSLEANLVDEDSTTLYWDRPSTAITGAAWVGTTGHAIAAYHRDLADPGQLAVSHYTGTWTDPEGVNVAPAIGPRASMQLATVPGPHAVAVVQDITGKLFSKLYSEGANFEGTWTDAAGGAPLASSTLTPGAVPFGIATP